MMKLILIFSILDFFNGNVVLWVWASNILVNFMGGGYSVPHSWNNGKAALSTDAAGHYY